jgi:hypothetical protein
MDNGWGWKRLRQQGFLTIAIVLGGAAIAATILPNINLRGALIIIALVALLLGWIP